MKRVFDIVVVAPALILLAPVFVLVGLVVKLTSRGPVLFTQERMGRNLRPFRIYKFRTMLEDAERRGPGVTVQDDWRITRVGKVLRASKLDELPQLFNVLKGDMSLVGPRPELPAYVERFRDEFEEILKVRPGITDPASIVYRDEGAVLREGEDPERHYLEEVLPHKLRLSKTYAERASVGRDILVILQTLACLVARPGSKQSHGRRGRRHGVLTLLVDLLLMAAAFYGALYLRFDGSVPQRYREVYLAGVPFLLVIRGLLFVALRVPQGMWRYAGLKSLQTLTLGVAGGSLGFWLFLRLGLGDRLISPRILVLDGLVCMALLVGARALRRGWSSLARGPVLPRRVLIFGSGAACERVLRDLALGQLPEYEAAGVVAADDDLSGLRIHGVPVLGPGDDLAALIRRTRAEQVWISGPIEIAAGASIARQCVGMGIPLKVVPDLAELLSSKELGRRLRRVEPEDLLFREPITTDPVPLKRFYSGRRILITGAGGSIGSEICRQLAACAPELLILLEKHEASLYAIERELRDAHPDTRIEPFIGDVTDPRRVAEVIEGNRPSIVVHAAAYKHVPMMERNPLEAFKTNAYGTKVMAEAAQRSGAEIFLLISTDKAVEPAGVMGLSKRLAELAIHRMGNRPPTRFMAVRFGNVLGSSGSVVPLFMDQIGRGGPVTVTDPEITRLCMTAREAVQLVLQAGTMGKGGEVFVLDMGRPIRILDLAKTMIRLYGHAPGDDIPIVFSGLRPGERRFEKLFNDHEKVWRTGHEKILMAADSDRGEHECEELRKILASFNGRIPPTQIAELHETMRRVLESWA